MHRMTIILSDMILLIKYTIASHFQSSSKFWIVQIICLQILHKIVYKERASSYRIWNASPETFQLSDKVWRLISLSKINFKLQCASLAPYKLLAHQQLWQFCKIRKNSLCWM
ncbi:hypothetical protein O6H91_09G109400 [Diphasiastrum complanatum]|uniref:Uncharacterized protein n=1 Tax=Diphasiastrum complanatum TaxID=34168 RepID=A0ACC2CU32_DIPCM|nr:hypothetical protein O6H91_09G109400 [Diphasiastrum complanatum]